MEQRPLGRTGRTISAIGLGCVTFGGEIDEEASYRVMDHAVENPALPSSTPPSHTVAGSVGRGGRRLSASTTCARSATR